MMQNTIADEPMAQQMSPGYMSLRVDNYEALWTLAKAVRDHQYGGEMSMYEAARTRDKMLLKLGLVREIENDDGRYPEYETTDPRYQ